MKSVLIIEDDPYVRRFYERLFVQDAWKAHLVGSGAEGLKSARDLRPDLILLDIMMPGMNGLEVLQQLKNDPNIASIPVLILTNFGEPELTERAMRLGAAGVMLKVNYSPEGLVREVMGKLGA